MNKDKAIYSLTEGKKLNLKREADFIINQQVIFNERCKDCFQRRQSSRVSVISSGRRTPIKSVCCVKLFCFIIGIIALFFVVVFNYFSTEELS